ncbi:phage major capsid protein [Mycoplasmopsis gallinarum]|uniref:phage major capsid protein n=1 Tax=Mycoplasmopsis gallinarum TaxID=29557 RepID=UPI00048239DF|nr:phage major capsid protein [Mycoplasmopsis gallinarum]
MFNDYLVNSPEYDRDFWNAVRGNSNAKKNLDAGKHNMTGTFKLPVVSMKKYKAALLEENPFRSIATIINAPGTDHTIKTYDAEDIATWLGENTLEFYDGVDDFRSISVENHRLGTIIRISDDFTADAKFDIEKYLTTSFAKRIGRTEEDAFVNGDGVDKPTGILTTAEVGAETSKLTYEDVVKLYFFVDKQYRKNGVWMMNDETAQTLRTLKDEGGNYIWNHTNDTIMGKRVIISNAMPTTGKPIAFGDFSYYWIVQRLPLTVRPLTEKYALHQQIGYLGYEHLDGKLIRSDAIKTLNITA